MLYCRSMTEESCRRREWRKEKAYDLYRDVKRVVTLVVVVVLAVVVVPWPDSDARER